MRKIFIILIFIQILFANAVYCQKNTSLSLNPSHVKWFKEAKFGMFIHWGLYSELGGSYKGRTLPDTTLANGESWYAEWAQTRLEIPREEYRKLIHQFNPTNFNAEQWILEAKNAGMKYFVITAKHHDGFALWDSQVSDYDIMNTPYKKDVIEELVKACKKHGLKYGFYYSHWQDWDHPQGALPVWMPPIREDKDFEKYWQEKCLPQVKELIQKFDPDLLWFDTWEDDNHITPYRRDELIALIRQNSEKCLINGRILFLNPGENIDFLEMHDNSYPKKFIEKPWQTPATMTHSWAWHKTDYNWKSSSQMIGYLANNASKGGNYLLNIGPKPDGTLPIPAIQRLREIGAWTNTYGEAIFDTEPVKLETEDGIYLTKKQKNNKLYVYVILKNEMEKLNLPISSNKIVKCTTLETDMNIQFQPSNNGVIMKIPQFLFNSCAIPVLKIELSSSI